MACSCLRPNYKGPGVGAWALGLSLQFAVGALMIFLGAESNLDLKVDPTSGIRFDKSITELLDDGNAWQVVKVFGWLHLIVAAAVGLLVTLGLFVCSIFLCPLCILGWIQTLYCNISCGVTGVYLRKYLDTLPGSARDGDNALESGDLLFAQINSGGLLLATVLSFVAGVVLGRASRVSSGESVPGTFMMLTGMGLFSAIGLLLAAGGGGWSPTPTLAAFWIVLTMVGMVFMNIRSCLCTRICNVLMVILFGVGAALSLITAAVFAHIYIFVSNHPNDKPDFTSLFIVMGSGGGVAACSILSGAALVFSVLAAFYSARSLICCGSGV